MKLKEITHVGCLFHHKEKWQHQHKEKKKEILYR